MTDNIVTVESVGYIQKTIVEVISMRDQCAMAALPALLARHRADVAWAEVAPLSYKIADAMLEARKEKK